MDKKFVLATFAGGITLFLLGGLFYDFLFHDYIKNATETASITYRKDPIVWIILLAEIITAGLVTLIFSRWATISTFTGGVKAGIIFGLLYGLGLNLLWFGTTNMGNLTTELVDSLLYMIRFTFAGGVIGWVLGRK